MRIAQLALVALLAVGAEADAATHWTAADTTALAGADGAAIEPAGLAVDAFGTRWVSDGARHRLVRFDASGRFAGESGALGGELGQFRRPGAVTRFGASAVAVLDRENRRVVAYDTHGRNPRLLVDLVAPALDQQVGRVDGVGLAADAGGALFVADGDRDRLLVFDFAGAFQRAAGGYGGGAGTFRHLVAVAAGPHGEVTTLEWLAGGKLKGRGGAADSVRAPRLRLQRFDAALAPLGAREWEAPASPQWSLAVDGERGLVAVAGADRVWCFAAGGDPGEPLPSTAAAALAFGPDGALHVAERGRLVRWVVTAE